MNVFPPFASCYSANHTAHCAHATCLQKKKEIELDRNPGKDLQPRRIELDRNIGTDPYQIPGKIMGDDYQNPVTEDTEGGN